MTEQVEQPTVQPHHETWVSALGYGALWLAVLVAIGSIGGGVALFVQGDASNSYRVIGIAAGAGGLLQAAILALIGGIALRVDHPPH